MPLKPFTVETAKRKFVEPFRAAFFPSVVESPNGRRAVQVLRSTLELPATPRPFSGRYPTRVLLFNREDGEVYYFGKRTVFFSLGWIQQKPSANWLEFDRGNLVSWISYEIGTRCVSNLATYYYQGSGNVGSASYLPKIVSFWGGQHWRYRIWTPPARDEDSAEEEEEEGEPEGGHN